MTKGEIALQLTLAMIEKGFFTPDDLAPEKIGGAVSKLYNAISQDIDIRGKDNT